MSSAVVLSLALLLALFFLRRSARLFVLDVEDGRIVRVQGYLPPRLRSEFEDVLGRARLPRARLVVVPRGGSPTLEAKPPLPEGVAQQLRNVLGQFTLAQLRAGRR